MALLINLKKLNDLYNKESKIEFISIYESYDSQMTIFWQFLKIAEWEKKAGFINLTEEEQKAIEDKEIKEYKPKDISEMNEIEIVWLLKKIQCSTITSAINHINTYKRYIDFKGVVNPFHNFDSYSELASEIVAKEKNKRYTRKDLLDMINELNNYTDQALLLALFEGIKGKSFSELLTLKTSNLENIGNEYFANVYDSGSQAFRRVKITETLYELLFKADKQDKYRTNNFMEIIETPFNESEFIFKKAKKGRQGGSVLDRHFITRKFVFFKEFFGNPYLSADDIVRSGMMYMAYTRYRKNHKIGKSELLEIGEQYNTIMATSNGKDFYRNITDIKRKVFNDQLGKLYEELRGVKYSD